MLKTYLTVMLGGAFGTGLRLWLSGAFVARYGETFPVGTLAVNVLGSFIIGLFVALTGPDGMLVASPLTRQIVTVGVLGGFTTFSAFSLQTINLLGAGEWLRAGLNILLSVALCLLAVWLGQIIAATFNQR
jgi:CrcB protein